MVCRYLICIHHFQTKVKKIQNVLNLSYLHEQNTHYALCIGLCPIIYWTFVLSCIYIIQETLKYLTNLIYKHAFYLFKITCFPYR